MVPRKMVVASQRLEVALVGAYVSDWVDLEAAAQVARQMDAQAAAELENDVLGEFVTTLTAEDLEVSDDYHPS